LSNKGWAAIEIADVGAVEQFFNQRHGRCAAIDKKIKSINSPFTSDKLQFFGYVFDV